MCEAAVKHTVAGTLVCFMAGIKAIQCSTILSKKEKKKKDPAEQEHWIFYYIMNMLKYNLVTAQSTQPIAAEALTAGSPSHC